MRYVMHVLSRKVGADNWLPVYIALTRVIMQIVSTPEDRRDD